MCIGAAPGTMMMSRADFLEPSRGLVGLPNTFRPAALLLLALLLQLEGLGTVFESRGASWAADMRFETLGPLGPAGTPLAAAGCSVAVGSAAVCLGGADSAAGSSRALPAFLGRLGVMRA